MKRLKPSTKLKVFVLVGMLAVVALAGLSAARIGGITHDEARNQGATLNQGASCHAPIPNDNVRAVLIGVPGNYTAMATVTDEYEPRQFNITVRVVGGPDGSTTAGFNLRVSDGSLAPADGHEDSMRIETDGLEATHSFAGIQQTEWELVWTAPEEASSAVVFDLVVNSIYPPEERDPTSPAPSSQWNVASFVSWGAEGSDLRAGGTGFVRVEDFGVGWLAYWVGIVSFVFLGIVLVAYYVVFRYGETSKATDHRARKGKSK